MDVVRRITDLMDRLERVLWADQDSRMRADGWEVVSLGRWQRRYRHPMAARALASVRAREYAEQAREQARTRRPTLVSVGAGGTDLPGLPLPLGSAARTGAALGLSASNSLVQARHARHRR